MTIAYNLGIGTSIIQLLRHYGKVPVEFLVDKLHTDWDDVEEYLAILIAEGAVAREGDFVELVPEH